MSKRILAGSLVLAAAVMPVGLAQTGAPAAQAPAATAPVPNCPELATALTRVLGQDVRLRDWPNLARYREANRSVTRADVVFMGDSITDSWQNPLRRILHRGQALRRSRHQRPDDAADAACASGPTSSSSNRRSSSFWRARTTSPATPGR